MMYKNAASERSPRQRHWAPAPGAPAPRPGAGPALTGAGPARTASRDERAAWSSRRRATELSTSQARCCLDENGESHFSENYCSTRVHEFLSLRGDASKEREEAISYLFKSQSSVNQ